MTLKINGKRLIIVVSLVAILSFAIGYYSYQLPIQLYKHKNPQLKDNVYVFIEKADEKYTVTSPNIITNIGENLTRVRHSRNQSATDYALYWISIGNSSISATKTQLDAQYMRNMSTIVEWTNGTDYAMNCSYTWTFTETQTVNASGSHWDLSGDNNLYALASFTQTTFNNNDNLTIRWVYTFDAN